MSHSNGARPRKTSRALFPPTSLFTSDKSPSQNKLLTYRRHKEQQKRLHQLLIDQALKAYHVSMEEKRNREPIPPIPELPSTMRSELKQQTENYLFLKECVLRNPIAPIQRQWLVSMLTLVPQSLMEGKDRQPLVEKLLVEIMEEYEKSMRRFVVQNILIKPDIKGLEDEEEVPLPSLPIGLDFSSPWHKSFTQAKSKILSKLHILHPTMISLLDFGYTAFFDFLLMDFSSLRLKEPIDCESLKTDVSLSCYKAEEKILVTWYQKVINLFTQNEALNSVKLDQLDSFYNCVAVLMSNQVKDLLTRTVEAYVNLFDPEDRNGPPLFKMELTLGDQKIEFYPSLQDLEEGILCIANHIGQTLQNIQTVHSWLTGDTATLDTELPEHVLEWATSTLKKRIRDNLEGPKKYFEKYVEKYGWLVDGTAQARIERFEAEEHSFDEYTALIDEFFTHKKEILSLPEVAYFPMIYLNSEDLKQGLASSANTFAKVLMDRIVANYREENEKICREFEAIKECALKVPETTEEMVETVAHIEKVKDKDIKDLLLRIKKYSQQLFYFLDNFLFDPEDIALNATVQLWPKRIDSIFDEHDDLIEKSKRKGEQELMQKHEKLVMDLEKLTLWMDSTFMELNREKMETEVDEFYRKIYKMSRFFQQKQKKMQQEKGKTTHAKLEEKRGETKANPIIAMGTSVLEQIKDFKENIPTVTVFCNPGMKACHWEQIHLIQIQDIIDEGLKVQVQWLYLEPIFSSEDIMQQMPEEGLLFQTVDRHWKDIMKHCAKDPKVLVVTSLVGLLEKLQNSNELPDKIMKGLNTYLEKKRLFFPRFIFLSSDEILEILSETKDPLRVQPHLKECFEGIAKLDFLPNLDIKAMYSSEGKHVELISNISTSEARGPVEKWLIQVEDVMLKTIRDVIARSRIAYIETERKRWVLEWPGQVVLCVSQMFWTSEVPEVLCNGPKSLKDYYDTLQLQLNDVVELVGKLSKQTRTTLCALVTTDVHARDVIRDTIESGNYLSHVSENVGEWQKICDSKEPQSFPLPEPLNNTLSELQKIIILRCLRPDKIVPAITTFITDNLGKKFVEPPPFDLAKSYLDSHSTVPLIFVLSPGADPMTSLLKLANDREMAGDKFQFISLAQGQGPIATQMIEEGMEKGTWVCLQNCRLAVSWMPMLEKICEEFSNDRCHPDFRLWLTSCPSPKFPVTILQNGLKMTTEPPIGLRLNLLQSFLSHPISDPTFFAGCPEKELVESDKEKLLFGVCFFHALVQERRKFGPLGWNIPYSEINYSCLLFQLFINEYSKVPFEAISYLTGECNHGGRVTGDWDRCLLLTMLDDFYNPDIIENPHYTFSLRGQYFAPPKGTYEDYIEFIKHLPFSQRLEVFGLHENVDISEDLQQTKILFESLLLTQGKGTQGTSGDDDSTLYEIADDILNKLPNDFDVESCLNKYPVRYEESMNTVLVQEIERFNSLIRTIRVILINLKKAIKGLVVVDAELEGLCCSLLIGQVPEKWANHSYPSVKPLGSYSLDFLERLKFLQDWYELGKPAAFWLSGFYFTSFLTAAMQNYARKHKIPIDLLGYEFQVIPQDTADTPPEDGVYIHGLFLDGAHWDRIKRMFTEQCPKLAFDAMPIMWIKPTVKSEVKKSNAYICPLYKTSEHKGVLSTTGHSTNFVIALTLNTDKPIQHWIKQGVVLLCQLDD
ncbi:LOW QUALITY PROTEIN: dynein axonemal heavy chain 12 [Ara ararauna]